MTIIELPAAGRSSGLSNGSDSADGANSSNANSSKSPFINNPPPVSSERKCLEDRYCDSMICLSAIRLNATEDAACSLDDGDFEKFNPTSQCSNNISNERGSNSN